MFKIRIEAFWSHVKFTYKYYANDKKASYLPYFEVA